MTSFIERLVTELRVEHVTLGPELDQSLSELDALLAELAARLEVEYYGPGVGVDGACEVYRLVVRPHEWHIHHRTWSLKICDGTARGGWRPAWAIQGAGRRRKAAVVKALPAFFAGYAHAVEQAGKGDTPEGRRVRELAEAFNRLSSPSNAG